DRTRPGLDRHRQRSQPRGRGLDGRGPMPDTLRQGQLRRQELPRLIGEKRPEGLRNAKVITFGTSCRHETLSSSSVSLQKDRAGLVAAVIVTRLPCVQG